MCVEGPDTREIYESSLALYLNFTLVPFWARNNIAKYHPKRINPPNPITYFLFQPVCPFNAEIFIDTKVDLQSLSASLSKNFY